jgi:transcriptional regulator with XRE-family HTH domain
VNVVKRPENQEHQRLSMLLKHCRKRLDPGCGALGSFLRLRVRVGKPVTQEEVAEAADVTRQWYMMMENGRAIRVSASVLARVADALMMDPAERAMLFRLGVPELRYVSPIDENGRVDILRSLRPVAGRLSSAKTESEVLNILCAALGEHSRSRAQQLTA